MGKVGDKIMSENNAVKDGAVAFGVIAGASEILKNSYNLVPTGKVYSAGLTSLIDVSRSALGVVAGLTAVKTAWNLIFKGNSK